MKVYLHNLGCAKNQKDGEYALSKLIASGYIYTNKPKEADIVLVNTCAFIDSAKEESVSEILELAELKKNNCKYLIMMGCLAELNSKELFKELKEVDLFLGVNDFNKIDEFINLNKRDIKVSKNLFINSDNSYINVLYKNKIINSFVNTAFIKISEGCNNFCSYCTIPFIRGTLRYKDTNNLINEIQTYLNNGVIEIVLIAQDLTSNISFLKNLLIKISKLKIKPKFVRLMYCNPWGVDKELINIIKNEEFICNYLDLPIQHISNKILKSMNRKINKNQIYELLENLYESKIILRSTIITGFPGETEKDFEELVSLLKKEFFMWLGVFVYSPQENTKAFFYKDKVDEKIAIERRNILDSIQFDITSNKLEEYINTNQYIIIDNIDKTNKASGRTYFQAPEVDGCVIINKFVNYANYIKVNIKELVAYDLIGVVKTIPVAIDSYKKRKF